MSELASQESRHSQNPPNHTHLDHRLTQGPGPPPSQVNQNQYSRLPGHSHNSMTSNSYNNNNNSLDERPAPQGSSGDTGGTYNSGCMSTLSSSSEKNSKRREGRKEASRTRHVSGNESRRSVSASRYNSYSSDEQG